MIIGSLSENKEIEKRISITPEIVKKYLSNGFEVLIDKGFGEHLGFSDDLFKNAGCKVEDKETVIDKSDIMLQMNLPDDKYINLLKENMEKILMTHILTFFQSLFG